MQRESYDDFKKKKMDERMKRRRQQTDALEARKKAETLKAVLALKSQMGQDPKYPLQKFEKSTESSATPDGDTGNLETVSNANEGPSDHLQNSDDTAGLKAEAESFLSSVQYVQFNCAVNSIRPFCRLKRLHS